MISWKRRRSGRGMLYDDDDDDFAVNRFVIKLLKTIKTDIVKKLSRSV